MPVITVPLPETEKSILNSAYYGIVINLAQQLGIPPTKIVAMHKDIEINKTDNRNTMSINDGNNLPSTSGERKILAVITENYDEEYITTSAISAPDALPIFHDGQLDVVVYPIYIKSEVTISFQFTTPSKTEAKRIRDDIRMRLSQARNILHHQVEYNIIIPDEVEEFIGDVYDLRNRLIPEELSSYLLGHSTNRMHAITDLVGAEGNTRLAVRETESRIIGTFEFGSLPDVVESDTASNTYKLTIPYKFNFDVPRGLCLRYPPMICNRPMLPKYLQFVVDNKRRTLEDTFREQSFSNSLGAMAMFESQRQVNMFANRRLPLNLPEFDNFPVKGGHPGYVNLLTVLVSVDETDKKSLLNLKEIDSDYRLHPKFLEYVSTFERATVVNPYMSPFYFGLHQDGNHFDNNVLVIDPALNVASSQVLSLVRPTRISLSVCIDVTALHDSVKFRLYQEKNFALFYLSALMQAMRDFKHESAHLFMPDHSVHRFFIMLLSDAEKKKEYTFLRDAIAILSRQYILMMNLSHILKNGFPVLYQQICKHSDLAKFEVNKHYQANYINQAFYMMTTVMLTHVDAFDQRL